MIGEGLSRVPEGYTHRDTPPPQDRFNYVEYKEPKSGKPVRVLHPEITGIEKKTGELFQPDSLIKVKLPNATVDSKFKYYLGSLGVAYEEYTAARTKQTLTNRDILKTLHQNAVNKRLLETMRSLEQNRTRLESREEKDREIDGFLIQLINESGRGQAFAGTEQNKSQDKIDFFVVVDPKKLGLEKTFGPQPAYFGIKHNMNRENQPPKARQKQIPEHAEYGWVTQAPIDVNREDYFPEANVSYDLILNRIRSTENRVPKASEAFLYEITGKGDGIRRNNSMTEADGREIILRRVQEFYGKILNILETAGPADNDQKRKEALLKAVIEGIKKDAKM